MNLCEYEDQSLFNIQAVPQDVFPYPFTCLRVPPGVRIPQILDNPLIDGSEVVSFTEGRFFIQISVRDCVNPRAVVLLVGVGY
jgi:hypothetical protein